ncbi:MAG: hypothetical protein E7426_04965 [Ruminococcaceae bacterium]|jgi:hypothetical protein|nr:hypothetical protein [Oscillospiraceae bacterium]
MRRIAALLLALLTVMSLTGCLGRTPEEEEQPDMGTINVLRLIQRADATDFPVDEEFADKKVTRFQLAQALQEAAAKPLDAAVGINAGLAPGQDGYWSRSAHLEGTAEGFSPKDLWLEMTCGLTENVVRVTAHQGSEWGACYVRGPELYTMLRHWRDRELEIDEEAYEKVREQVDSAIEAICQSEKATGQPYTGWELTEFRWLTDYVDTSDDSTIHIYSVDYAMLTDDPGSVKWSGDMALDSAGRVENVGDFGRLATRWWWWGSVNETAILGRDRDPETEFEEARTALNENNPRS